MQEGRVLHRGMRKQFVISPKQSRRPDHKRSELVSIILLSENHGYRMKSYGPISLVKIGEKTLLEHQVDAVSSAFINFEIVLCAGFETNKIYNFVKKTYGPSCRIRIVENQVYYHSNCCESIRLCMNNVMTDKIIICGGGVLLTSYYLKNLDLRRSSLLYQDSDKKDNFDIGVIENSKRLEMLSLAAKDKTWTELFYISGDRQVNSFYSIVSKPEFKTKFFFEAINSWGSKGSIITTQNESDSIIKINNIKTLKRVNDENFTG